MDFYNQSGSLVGPKMIKYSKMTKNGNEDDLTRCCYNVKDNHEKLCLEGI